MTDKNLVLKVNLSKESRAKLQARIPKPLPPKQKMAIEVPRQGKVAYINPVNKAAIRTQEEAQRKAQKKVKKAPTIPKPKTVKNSPMDMGQYLGILKALNKNNKKAFPNGDKPMVALKVGIHKDIAQIFKITPQKAYWFLMIYCSTKRYKEAVSKSGAPRYDLKGKKVAEVD